MFFSRITINSLTNLSLFTENICRNSYKEHQAVWTLFNDPNVTRDFLYHYENVSGQPVYYVVSRRRPENWKDIWNVETRDYNPVIRTGQVFSFVLRANPVVTINSRRHDVVMHEKKKMNYSQLPEHKRPLLQDIVKKSGYEWLASRADKHGFLITESMLGIDGYQTHRTYKKNNNQPISYSVMDFKGILTVTNEACFKQTLFNGIGRSKAFGCGMIMIRPIKM